MTELDKSTKPTTTHWKYLVPMLVSSCLQGETVPSDQKDDEEEPWCEQSEWEPNDTFAQADYICVLPPANEECIEGLIAPQYQDTFLFFLRGTNDNIVPLSLSVEILNELSTPKITLYQTDHDENGIPTGKYNILGQIIGEEGWLLILDWPIRYDFIHRNDLFIKLEMLAPPGPASKYKISTWNTN